MVKVCHSGHRQSRTLEYAWLIQNPKSKIHSFLVQLRCIQNRRFKLAKFYYGGQAVIEGVMMRGQKHMAVAVRAPDGEIVVREEPLNAAIYKHPIMKLPFLR